MTSVKVSLVAEQYFWWKSVATVKKQISKQCRFISCFWRSQFVSPYRSSISLFCRYSGPRKKKVKTEAAKKPLEYVNNAFIKVNFFWLKLTTICISWRIVLQLYLWIKVKSPFCRTTPLKQSCCSCLILYQKSSLTSQCGDHIQMSIYNVWGGV